MRFGSICSGIDAASVAWEHLGWKCQFFAENDKFPSALLAQRHPHVPNFGDITKFKEWPDAAIDVLVGGTPCQSFSVAGLRGGLADPRGNLMLTYLAIAARYRPEWLVWENVPGVLSSNGGRDFGSLLGRMGKLGYGFAYRVLDAQYFNLAQRRERVFVVGCLGGWQRAAAVLFECASLRGDSAPSRQAGKGVAAPITAGSPGGSGYRNDPDTSENLISHALQARGDPANNPEHETYVVRTDMAVRRLTPTECEKLQGFYPGYTAIAYRGKPAADGPRYKALGNSMAVTVMNWIGRRIASVNVV
jgi:DNA (cytosine-5)-methyltransferase 1